MQVLNNKHSARPRQSVSHTKRSQKQTRAHANAALRERLKTIVWTLRAQSYISDSALAVDPLLVEIFGCAFLSVEDHVDERGLIEDDVALCPKSVMDLLEREEADEPFRGSGVIAFRIQGGLCYLWYRRCGCSRRAEF
eukprot:5846450-Pyramimonas_sp.AAC.1